MQRTLPEVFHVAIIMDGNGRWARARALPRLAGHRQGAAAVRRVVEAAPGLGITTLTLFAFSSDNWKRPPAEVRGLMRLFRFHLRSETAELRRNGVRLRVIGRRDRLPSSLLAEIDAAETATAGGRRLELRVAVDYSARETLLAAARHAHSPEATTRAGFARVLGAAMNLPCPSQDVDLLIRTGGEQRLSDFLLWECGYAELYFSPLMWPDFSAAELDAAVGEFRRRDRRFGAVPEEQNPPPRHRVTEDAAAAKEPVLVAAPSADEVTRWLD